jgi:hypothetical protein
VSTVKVNSLSRLGIIVLLGACVLEGPPLFSRQTPMTKSPTIPKFSHVLVIVFENREYGDVVGNSKLRNFNGYARSNALLTRYFGVTHPSLPNYLALLGGDTFGIRTDCVDCFIDARSLPDLLESAGRTWKSYQEGLPEAGFSGPFQGNYAMKHNPFVYFDAIRNNPDRLRGGVVPLSELEADLAAGTLPDFAFITPDMCHSGHDCDSAMSDAWLGRMAGLILASPSFDASSLLVLTFDEGTSNQGCCGSKRLANGGRIATVLVSPLVRPGFKDPTPYSHYSLLKTIARSWGLEELGKAADTAVSPIALPWK